MKRFALAAALGCLALLAYVVPTADAGGYGHVGVGRAFGFNYGFNRSFAFGYPSASVVVPGAAFVPAYGYAPPVALIAPPAAAFAAPSYAPACGVTSSASYAAPAMAPTCGAAPTPALSYGAPALSPGAGYAGGVGYSAGVGFAPVYRGNAVFRSALYGQRAFFPFRAFGAGVRTFGRAVFGPRAAVVARPRVFRPAVVVRAPGVRVRVR